MAGAGHERDRRLACGCAIRQAREICEQAFGFSPTDREWREEMLPQRRERAQRLAFNNGG